MTFCACGNNKTGFYLFIYIDSIRVRIDNIMKEN